MLTMLQLCQLSLQSRITVASSADPSDSGVSRGPSAARPHVSPQSHATVQYIQLSLCLLVVVHSTSYKPVESQSECESESSASSWRSRRCTMSSSSAAAALLAAPSWTTRPCTSHRNSLRSSRRSPFRSALNTLHLRLLVRRPDALADQQHHATEVAKLEDAVVARVEAAKEEHELLELPVSKSVEDVVRHGGARAVERVVKVAAHLVCVALSGLAEHMLRERAVELHAHLLALEWRVHLLLALSIFFAEEPSVCLQVLQAAVRVLPAQPPFSLLERRCRRGRGGGRAAPLSMPSVCVRVGVRVR